MQRERLDIPKGDNDAIEKLDAAETVQEQGELKPEAEGLTPAYEGGETVAASSTEASEGPPLKKTWMKPELLIDDELGDLPGEYERDRAVLMVRDPFWVHAYWDLDAESVARAKLEGGAQLTLRVHDVTDLIFNGTNSHYHFDVAMPFDFQRVWYFNVPNDGRTYLAEVGYLRPDGRFIPLARSNAGTTPQAKISSIISDRFVDPEASQPIPQAPAPQVQPPAPPVAPVVAQAPELVPQQPAPVMEAPAVEAPAPMPENLEISEQMYRLSLRGTPYWSANIPKYGDYLIDRATSSEGMPLAAMSSAQHAPQPPAPKAKDFWLVADCELIVYGATEPDAKVTLRGQAVDLRPDGTFSLRFALPDGLHPIPIHAVNADGDMERSLTITVSRNSHAPS
ncbi:DUF4912 domain-containing protein [bacterium]|nr:DUF4912 domain-containing protein [bacterium]